MRFNGPLSPGQAAAFWKLGLLNGDDLRRLAMQWLEDGAEPPTVAVLAGERDTTLRDHGVMFERTLAEYCVAVPTERRAAWIVAQTLLRAAGSGFDALDATHDIMQLHHKGLELFPPRGLAPGGRPFAGEELGIEQMLGLYYSLDDVDEKTAKRLLDELRVEAGKVLAEFYSEPPDDLGE